MTRLKKFFAMFICVLAVCMFLPIVGSAAEIVDSGACGKLTWSLDSDGVLTIQGEGEMADYDNNKTPWELYGFTYSPTIKSIIISDGVTRIGNQAFAYRHDLTSVDMPDSVTSIGDGAFFNCVSLTNIDIPDCVTSIGQGAFSDCHDLTSVDIPKSVTTISRKAFGGCRGLTNIVIPDGVTTIEYGAFGNCYNLTSVVIPKSVTKIGEGVFYNCAERDELELNYMGSKKDWENIEFEELQSYNSIIEAIGEKTADIKVNFDFKGASSMSDTDEGAESNNNDASDNNIAIIIGIILGVVIIGAGGAVLFIRKRK